MGKKVPLARQQKERPAVLLADSGDGVYEDAPELCREEGQATTSAAEGDKRTKAGFAKKAGKSSTETKGGNGRRRKRGKFNPPGQSVRANKRANCPAGRSAQELGIDWLEERCEESPVSKAHYLIGKFDIGEGTVFECRYCHKVKWLPASMDDCLSLHRLIHIYGLSGGYQRMLDYHPAAKRLISKIQDIYYLRKSMPADQFPIAVAAVMLDREYPHDVEITEEEIL